MCYALGAFAKLRKAIISLVMFVCPSLRSSVRMELGAHWTDFHEIRNLSISKIIIIIIWHYNPLWVFAFSAKSLQVLLSLAVSFQLFLDLP